jgi:hypothetical protein
MPKWLSTVTNFWKKKTGSPIEPGTPETLFSNERLTLFYLCPLRSGVFPIPDMPSKEL